jgi:hypothetical protein
MNLSFWYENWQGILTALVVGTTLLALLLGRRAPDMAMLGAVIVLLASGVLSPAEALSGMSNEGMLTGCSIVCSGSSCPSNGGPCTCHRSRARPTAFSP